MRDNMDQSGWGFCKYPVCTSKPKRPARQSPEKTVFLQNWRVDICHLIGAIPIPLSGSADKPCSSSISSEKHDHFDRADIYGARVRPVWP
jgi:hypothetical protein